MDGKRILGTNAMLALELWPGTTVPLVPVLVLDVELSESGYLEFSMPPLPEAIDRDDPLDRGRRLRTPPDELYLRELLDLDLADPGAILAFTRDYGRLESPDWSDLPEWLTGGRPPLFEAEPEVKALRELLERYDERRKGVLGISHLEVFRFHARILRDVVRLWSAHAAGEAARLDGQLWESVLGASFHREGGAALTELGTVLPQVLNAALRPYHVRFEMRAGLSLRPQGGPHPSLYSAMALQLANHVAEGAVPQRCHNCTRLFVRQRDRSQRGRRRTEGLLYCSKKCAWAAGQRSWREKAKQRARAAELAAQGLTVASIAQQLGVGEEETVELLSAPPKRKGKAT